ncbi:MAG: hypothetical protein IAB19_05725 [Proteobacteria bacterium]|uniref:Uncharacterized protein n=1 Tax=Candidatus Avisuccinivibrio stercorigallinarum TaxID=2840704 RepID=A0A9D9DCD8_9GAMM|nr:hypothetical protein [Candidatus Avisuccinivibrio stercorigallinarum]
MSEKHIKTSSQGQGQEPSSSCWPSGAGGEIKLTRYRKLRPNGDTYVYEKETRYDPQRRYNVVLRTRLLGKIPAGGSEMVPTRHKSRSKAAAKAALKTGTSATALPRPVVELQVRPGQLLDYLSSESGLGTELSRAFGSEEGLSLLSLAWCALCSRGTLAEIADWGLNHALPASQELTRAELELLCFDLGSDRPGQQDFFQGRSELLAADGGKALLIDLPELDLLLLCSRAHFQVLSFARLPPGDAARMVLMFVQEELAAYCKEDCLQGFISEKDLKPDDEAAWQLKARIEHFAAHCRPLFDLTGLTSDEEEECWRGRLLIFFTALCLYLKMEAKLKQTQDSVAADLKRLQQISGGAGTELTAALSSLLTWLKNRDARRVLAWFDGPRMHEGSALTPAAQRRMSQECLTRDLLFLRYFGYSAWAEQHPQGLLL